MSNPNTCPVCGKSTKLIFGLFSDWTIMVGDKGPYHLACGREVGSKERLSLIIPLLENSGLQTYPCANNCFYFDHNLAKLNDSHFEYMGVILTTGKNLVFVPICIAIGTNQSGLSDSLLIGGASQGMATGVVGAIASGVVEVSQQNAARKKVKQAPVSSISLKEIAQLLKGAPDCLIFAPIEIKSIKVYPGRGHFEGGRIDIRANKQEHVFLLNKEQLNGFVPELTSFCKNNAVSLRN